MLLGEGRERKYKIFEYFKWWYIFYCSTTTI